MYLPQNQIKNLPGLSFYVDRLVNNPTIAGTDVTGWIDLSGQGNDLNTASATKPQWSAGNGVVFLNANSTFLERTSIDLVGQGLSTAASTRANSFAMGLIVRLDATVGADQNFFGNLHGSAGGVGIGYSDGNAKWVTQYSNVGSMLGPALAPGNPFKIITFRRAFSGFADFRINNVAFNLGTPFQYPLSATGNTVLGAITMGAGRTFAAQNLFASCTVAAAFICSTDPGPVLIGEAAAFWASAYGL